MRRFLLIGGLGCGAVVFLALALFVGVVIGSSGSDSPDSALEKQESGEGAEQQEPGTTTATLRVTGTEGLAFSGSYGNTDGIQSVDGTVPHEFDTQVDVSSDSPDRAAAILTKTSPGEGALTAQIVVDGEVVKEATTTAEYGATTVVWGALDR